MSNATITKNRPVSATKRTPSSYATHKEQYAAKIETLRRKSVRSEKYRSTELSNNC